MAGLREILQRHTDRLLAAGVDSPRLSAEVLLAFALGMTRAALIKRLLMDPETPPETDAAPLIARRERGEPVAYITGSKEFYGRDFVVTKDTLIPRPDTETLIDAARAFAASYSPPAMPPQFLDLGTGSGAIAVTLALELPVWRGLAVDISPGALAVAAHNARSLGALTTRFLCEDFFSPALPPGPYDLLVANPPYVSEEEYQALSPEITAYEPKSALVPDAPQATGLECLLAIINIATHLLRPGGLLLMEMGLTQGLALLDYAATQNSVWKNSCILHDMADHPRVFSAMRT